jgi:DNA-binding CsgD family transcriptional regulator/PAS domain-containing protein
VDDIDRISELVGLIYDAALDPELWPNVLGRTARFVPGASAAMFAKDASSKSGNIYYDDGGVTAEAKATYFETYIKIDPLVYTHVFAEIGEPVSTTSLMPYAEFTESRFYKEWVRPQGFVDFGCVVLDKWATGAAMYGLFRDTANGLVDDEAVRRMRLLAPHLRRAALIGRVIDLKTAQAATFADTLDNITAGMFLVDETGRVVHANAAGTAMLSAGKVVRTAAGRLTTGDAQGDEALAAMFASSGSDDALGVRGIAVPLNGRDGERYVAHLLPLTSSARRQAGTSFSASAALFVRKAGLEGPSVPELIAKTYKLTPTELRVMLAVVEVGGAPEVADALGVAETTVKFHLKRLFEKTDTRRQADLVKIVAGYANMPAG